MKTRFTVATTLLIVAVGAATVYNSSARDVFWAGFGAMIMVLCEWIDDVS